MSFDPATIPVGDNQVLLGLQEDGTVRAWVKLTYDTLDSRVQGVWPRLTEDYVIDREPEEPEEHDEEDEDEDDKAAERVFDGPLDKALTTQVLPAMGEYRIKGHTATFAIIGHVHGFRRLRGRRVISSSYSTDEHNTYMSLLGQLPTEVSCLSKYQMFLYQKEPFWNLMANRLLEQVESDEE